MERKFVPDIFGEAYANCVWRDHGARCRHPGNTVVDFDSEESDGDSSSGSSGSSLSPPPAEIAVKMEEQDKAASGAASSAFDALVQLLVGRSSIDHWNKDVLLVMIKHVACLSPISIILNPQESQRMSIARPSSQYSRIWLLLGISRIKEPSPEVELYYGGK